MHQGLAGDRLPDLTHCGFRYNRSFRKPPFSLRMPADIPAAQVIGVSALNRLAREALETGIPLLWVGGEISNLTRASSGHLYFTLKDAQAQVRCAMWRNRAQLLAFRPENGMKVEARALVTLYEARGDYQLNVEALRPAGIGNLFEAFNRLKDKLSAEGLFDPERRRQLPRFPRGIGVVTSPAAAALRDVIATLHRRCPQLPLVIYPAPVQGADAPARLIGALQQAGRRAASDGIDLILLVRGGGSIEDLWAFNDEGLARAIRACPVPVVSGVGHETDFTIADFAADLRAATPTGAAELASAGYHAAHGECRTLELSLTRTLQRKLESLGQRLDRCALRLVHPRERLRRAVQTTDALRQSLQRAMRTQLERSAHRQAQLAVRLRNRRPDPARSQQHVEQLADRLRRAAHGRLDAHRRGIAALGAHLQHLAPEAVLARGYSITRDAAGNILRSAVCASVGDTIRVQLSEGELSGTVSGKR